MAGSASGGAVHLLKVLLINPQNVTCPKCLQVARGVLNSAVLSEGVEVADCPHVPDGMLAPPDLVVLQSARVAPMAEALHGLRERWARVPALGVFCDGSAVAGSVLELLRNGLDDFVACPVNEPELISRIQRLLPDARRVDTGSQPAGVPELEGVVGDSDALRAALRKIPCIAQSNASVIVSGETGTGKELFARAIHYSGPRRSHPFVPVNCGGMPDNLLENELFGHAKGAYTDARSAYAGLISVADRGTLFLDEVDSLSLSAQVKLLRFLQDHEYRPLGSSTAITVDIRIIAATNADLRTCIRQQSLRQDLFHRLNVLSLSIPPLRERMEDVPKLARHFLAKYVVEERRNPMRFAPAALHKLMSYDWPGNVREVQAVIQRAAVMTPSPVIEPQDIELPAVLPDSAPGTGMKDAKTHAIRQFERAYLVNLLTTHRGNLSKAAKEAGKDRRAIQRLLRRHDLRREQFRQ